MEPHSNHWLEKAAAVLWAIFCFELGVFLLVFPWLDYWQMSRLSSVGFSFLGPEWGGQWERVWDSAWFRGAVSGMGVVNIMISFVEAVRLRRFAGASRPE